VKGSAACSSARLPLQLTAGSYKHHATFRGHGFPVFSLLLDKQGQRVVTGADDAMIKVRAAWPTWAPATLRVLHFEAATAGHRQP
jgi:hypothetical protein